MDKLNQISDLEKQIEVLKEEMQKDNKIAIEKIYSNMNIYHLYYSEGEAEIEMITDIDHINNIDHIMEEGYIKVEEYINVISGKVLNPVEIKVLNRIKDLETNLSKKEESVKIRENENTFVGEDDYTILENLKDDIWLLKSMLD